MATASERVNRGAAELDQHSRGVWQQLIDLNVLDVASSRTCILGQLYVNYWRAPDWALARPEELGFCYTRSDEVRMLRDIAELNQAWRDYLTTWRRTNGS